MFNNWPPVRHDTAVQAGERTPSHQSLHSKPESSEITMKLLTFAATNSIDSLNKQLVAYASRLLEGGLVDDVEIETIDLNDFEMPIYSIDRQNDGGIPAAAQDFFAKIGAADAILISFAEHNGFYTSAYKNIFDWVSRVDMRVYQDKPTVMFSTSIGPGGGGNVLKTAAASAQFFGNDVLATLSVPSFHDNFDTTTGALSNDELDAQFKAALTTLSTITAYV
jgi:NAD(P)H-dependent FMN reductase